MITLLKLEINIFENMLFTNAVNEVYNVWVALTFELETHIINSAMGVSPE